LKTTKESGLAKMEIAAQEGDFAWIEARSLLSFIYLWEAPNIPKALEHTTILAEKFPKNFYFVLMYSESLIKTGNFEKANSVLAQLDKNFNDLTKIQKHHMKSYLDYEWALYWFEQGNLEKAINFAKTSINDYKAELDIYLANSLLLLGNIHDLKENRSKAKDAYKRCIKLDNNSEAVLLAKIYFEEPFKR